MPDDLRVNGWLLIPGSELHERFSRSSGPGGQSVNTADSRVELSFDVQRSSALPEWARARVAERLAGRLAGGVLTVTASEQRSQLANRQGARARLAALLRDAVAPPQRPRVPTRPSRGANERRLGPSTTARDQARPPLRPQGTRVTGRIACAIGALDHTAGERSADSGPHSEGTLTTIASWVDLAITTTASVSGEGFSSRCGTCGGTQNVVSRRRLQPDQRSALRVAEDEHRVAGYHVDARFRGSVVMVTGRRAGQHHGPPHPQLPRADQITGNGGRPEHPAGLRGRRRERVRRYQTQALRPSSFRAHEPADPGGSR